ncbi:hypothetical protein K0O13_08040 [Mammaliicoccus sciuri]|uniref:hypothetical protein n=1 Tax=Mammaliicoccus sciuri TaxID=1296 RepID=UPI001C6286CC|nr:hypothetical protein [Mammaliicoccus sciuri]QYG30050.1 hypothetical protein K0O13_08040 [Mammaliicoccus sciuri]
MLGNIIIGAIISVLVIILIATITYDMHSKKKNLNKLRKLSLLTLSDLHIEKFNKYVDLKMMSGDSFYNVDMEEYESINDPMKKGSYRIHRGAIESEEHHSLGKGYFIFDGKRMNVKIYGDEDKNIIVLKAFRDSSLEITGFNTLTWNFRNEPYKLVAGNTHRFTTYEFKIEK